jgi:hypothetical protein
METQMLIDVWGLMKSYVSAKDKSVVAGKFVDIAMDNGVQDEELKELIGHDDDLDEAIRYNLDIEQDEEDFEDA